MATPTVETPQSTPLRDYLQGSWECLIRDSFAFVADGDATVRLEVDDSTLAMWLPEYDTGPRGTLEYRIDGDTIHATAPEVEFEATIHAAETVGMGDEFPLVVEQWGDNDWTVEVLKTGFEIRDPYRVGIVCDRL
ncbi:MAG: hypothetical protein EOO67_00905 [Microbacterium sp.]|nr:MAG: hypothetical protein EOO67_00905 [Microbacterium sp.]